MSACSTRCQADNVVASTPWNSDVDTRCPRPVCSRTRSAALMANVARYAAAMLTHGTPEWSGPGRGAEELGMVARLVAAPALQHPLIGSRPAVPSTVSSDSNKLPPDGQASSFPPFASQF